MRRLLTAVTRHVTRLVRPLDLAADLSRGIGAASGFSLAAYAGSPSAFGTFHALTPTEAWVSATTAASMSSVHG